MNERLFQIILAPWVTEKTARAGSDGQYVFRVASCATKKEIKAAVKQLFNVDVKSVRIVNVKPKSCRSGRRLGRHQGWKKAYVSLPEGNHIDIPSSA